MIPFEMAKPRKPELAPRGDLRWVYTRRNIGPEDGATLSLKDIQRIIAAGGKGWTGGNEPVYLTSDGPGGGIFGSGSGVNYLGNLALRSGAERYWGGSYGGGYGGGGGSGAYGGGAGIGFGSIGFYGASLGLPGSFGIWGGGGGDSPALPPREL
jgi:hypothetical protein